MPKKSKYPGLRARTRVAPSGKVWTGYYYCKHGQKKEVPLGTNWDDAVAEWKRMHLKEPSQRGTLAQAFDKFEREVLPSKNPANRRDYAQHLKVLRPVFDSATWDTIKRPILRAYLDKRTAKSRGPKEIKFLGYVWECAKDWGMTNLDNPIRGWKIGETLKRKMYVSDEAFDALYEAGDSVVRDAMDIMTATGARLGDVLKALLTDVRGDVLRITASKTGKTSDFLIAGSVLERIIKTRRENKEALHIWLLTTPEGKRVTPAMLRNRWDAARAKAAEKMPEVAAIFLRDMRKRAANLAESADEAAKLLQHSSTKVTNDHYRETVDQVRPVR